MYTINLKKNGNRVRVARASSSRGVSIQDVHKSIQILHKGIRGEKGDPGEPGEPGEPGVDGDKHFSQNFSVTDTVSVTHNLNKLPAVTIMDSANDEVVGMVNYIDQNSLTVEFDAPFSGKITCN